MIYVGIAYLIGFYFFLEIVDQAPFDDEHRFSAD